MKTVDFSETIGACDLKVGRCRQLIEIMKFMSIEGQGHFFTIYFPGFVCFVLYLAKISGERLQDHWSSGLCFASLFAHLSSISNNFNCNEESWILGKLNHEFTDAIL